MKAKESCNCEECNYSSCGNCSDCSCKNQVELKDVITEEKLDKYNLLTSDALKIAKKSIIKGKEKQGKEIVDMVSNYINDSKFFRQKNDFVNCFAALNYAHGWLDSGVRLGIFNVSDDKLFTVK